MRPPLRSLTLAALLGGCHPPPSQAKAEGGSSARTSPSAIDGPDAAQTDAAVAPDAPADSSSLSEVAELTGVLDGDRALVLVRGSRVFRLDASRQMVGTFDLPAEVALAGTRPSGARRDLIFQGKRDVLTLSADLVQRSRCTLPAGASWVRLDLLGQQRVTLIQQGYDLALFDTASCKSTPVPKLAALLARSAREAQDVELSPSGTMAALGSAEVYGCDAAQVYALSPFAKGKASLPPVFKHSAKGCAVVRRVSDQGALSWSAPMRCAPGEIGPGVALGGGTFLSVIGPPRTATSRTPDGAASSPPILEVWPNASVDPDCAPFAQADGTPFEFPLGELNLGLDDARFVDASGNRALLVSAARAWILTFTPKGRPPAYDERPAVQEIHLPP